MRLNDGLPVWHASVSAQKPAPRPGTYGQFVHAEKLIEKYAVALLRGVGGTREWWIYNPNAHVGHLRVALTPEEATTLPPGIALDDAGPSGPQRARTP